MPVLELVRPILDPVLLLGSGLVLLLLLLFLLFLVTHEPCLAN